MGETVSRGRQGCQFQMLDRGQYQDPSSKEAVDVLEGNSFQGVDKAEAGPQ